MDKKQLQRDIFVKGEKIIKAFIVPLVEAKVRAAQEQMIKDFEKHEVTREIKAGNTASNTTGLLGGYGNLFSFIGFNEGDDPIEPLLAIFHRQITHTIKRTNDYGGFLVTINMPSKEELDSVAKIKWLNGRSWLDGIEKGLAGLNRYLYDDDYGFGSPTPSLSDTGIQAKHEIRNGVNYSETPYVSQILEDFRKRLAKLI